MVAGPSGAGKSTFIRLLQAKQLPPEIISRLPNNVEYWSVVSAHDFRKADSVNLGISVNGNPNEGLIVHYDFTFPHRCGIREYADDPASAILKYSESTTIISIMPSHSQLVAQFGSRLTRHLDGKSRARRLWRRLVHIPAGRLRTLFGWPARETSDLYAHPEWLHRTYQQWNAFLTSLLHQKLDVSLVHVEPVSDAPDGRPNFKLQREDWQQPNEAQSSRTLDNRLWLEQVRATKLGSLLSESRRELIFADLVTDQLVLIALPPGSLDATAVRDAGARGVLMLTRSANRIELRADDYVSAPMRRFADVGRSNCSVAILYGRSCLALANKRHFSPFKRILVPLDASFLFALVGLCRYLHRGSLRIIGKTGLACRGYKMQFIVLENQFVPGANSRLYGPAGKTPLEILREFSGINYVLLRSIERVENGSHTGDIDLLVSEADLDRLKSRLLTGPGTYPIDVYTEAGEHGHSYIGVPYFKPSLAKQMLATAHVRPSGIRTASAKWAFLSFCYHLLFHNRLATGNRNRETLHPGVFRKASNFDELKQRAVAAKMETPRTIRDLEQALHAENAFPSIDLIGFYSKKSPGLRRRYLEHGKTRPGLSVFFVRDFGAGLACVPAIREELKGHFTILMEGPVTPDNDREILSEVRGGNWQDQSAPGGIAKPIYWFVCWDDRPIPPSRKTRRKYPRLDNERIRLKAGIRKQAGVTTHKPQALIHSSDNTGEALEHLKKIGAAGHPALAALGVLCPVERGEQTADSRVRLQ